MGPKLASCQVRSTSRARLALGRLLTNCVAVSSLFWGGIVPAPLYAAEPTAAASDWAQFQGPLGNGTSNETGLLRPWPGTGPKVLWRVPIKPGWGSPSVVGDAIYLSWTEALRGNAESTVCLDAATGALRWQQTYEVGPYWERNIGWARGGFRATPAVAGERVYTLGAIGHLHCLDRHSGEVVWKKNLWDSWNPSGEKGYVFSPLVVEGKVILWLSDGASAVATPDQKEVVCLALDSQTGEVLWTFREPHREGPRMGEGQTPAIARFGKDLCLVGSANCELKALRIADGKEVWKFECVRLDGRGTTTPTPLVVDRYIVNIPDLDLAHAVEVDRTQVAPTGRLLWKKDLNMFTAIHQFRHRDGYLYGFAGQVQGATEQAASDSVLNLVCLELASGKVLWSEPGFKAGVALIEADGLLFCRSYQTLRLVEATPTGYHQLGEVHTHDTWQPTLNLVDFVSPILSAGRLLVRTSNELICYDVRAAAKD